MSPDLIRELPLGMVRVPVPEVMVSPFILVAVATQDWE